MKGRKIWLWRGAVLAAPLCLVIGYLLFRDWVPVLASHFPRCPFYTITGFWCPACGNTRSVLALLRGDIAGSLRYNITPALLGVIGILGYLELVLHSFGKRVRLLSRSCWFWYPVMGVMFLYYFLRNVIPGMLP